MTSYYIYTVQVLKIRSASYPRDVGDFKYVASNEVSPDAELIVIYYKLGRNIPLYFVQPIIYIHVHNFKTTHK